MLFTGVLYPVGLKINNIIDFKQHPVEIEVCFVKLYMKSPLNSRVSSENDFAFEIRKAYIKCNSSLFFWNF